MYYRYISDSHTHSHCSFDGTDSIVMMCEKASSSGLYSITITDHCECNEYFKENYRDAISNSILEISRARALYHDRVKVYTGVELGQPTQDIKACEDALSLTEYDFVLGSLHNMLGEQDFYFLKYTPESVPALLTRYFDEVLNLVNFGKFDSLAHLTYPLRYIIGSGIQVDLSDYSRAIETVLKALVKNHLALEINTSGLRQKIGKTLPDETIVKRFHELGGLYVTLGSDAHRWGDIGSGIEDGLEMLYKCGYTHFTVYEKRQPQLLPIR